MWKRLRKSYKTNERKAIRSSITSSSPKTLLITAEFSMLKFKDCSSLPVTKLELKGPGLRITSSKFTRVGKKISGHALMTRIK